MLILSRKVGERIQLGDHITVTDDETGIADAILNIMRDPDGAADQADEGRRMVLREYDWGPLAGKLEEIWTVAAEQRVGRANSMG